MEDKNKNLNDMLNEASQEETKNKFFNKKRILITIISAVIVVSLFGLGAVMLSRFNSNQDIQKGDQIEVNNQSAQDIYRGFTYPIVVPEWTKVPYLLLGEKGNTFFEDEILNHEATDWVRYSSGGEVAKVLPSRLAGYTNNMEEMTTESGALNVFFSYVLQEDIEFAVATYTHRLINPIFGSWESFQEYESNPKTTFTVDTLSDMFTQRWFDENIKVDEDYSKLPILADWDGELAKKYNFVQGESPAPRFFGLADQENISGSYVINDMGGIDSVTYVIPVTYSAFSETNELHEIKGTLTMKLVPNGADEEDSIKHTDYEHRFLIDDVSLTLN